MDCRNVAILLLVLVTFPAVGEAPRQLIDAVQDLAEPEAILNICFESEAYKQIDVTEALRLQDLSSRVWRLVDRISQQYDDDALYLAFGVMGAKKSEDPELQNYARETYQYCDKSLNEELSAYVGKAEARINWILDDIGEKGDKWPRSAMVSYIESCTEKLSSQGADLDKATQYCICTTEGIEEEFGLTEYEEMMQAQPDLSGSPYDGRLYKVFQSCAHVRPRQ